MMISQDKMCKDIVYMYCMVNRKRIVNRNALIKMSVAVHFF